MANSVQASRTRGKVMVEGPLRVGSDVLLSGNVMRGDVELVKRVPISARGQYTFRVPAANIISAVFNAEVSSAVGGDQYALRLGVSADDVKYGAVSNVSGVGQYTVTLSAPNVVGITSGATICVSLTALATAVNTLAGSLYVRYMQVGGAD